MPALHAVLTAARQTVNSAGRDLGIIVLLVIAPVAYIFFYSWPLSTQLALKIPVAVVDEDHSNVSRTIIRFAAASPKIEPAVMNSQREAMDAMLAGKIAGYLVIPRNLKHDTALNRPVKLRVYTNGSYALLNKSVSYGFLEAVGTVSAGIELKKLQAAGLNKKAANVARNPLDLLMKAHYNISEGYGSYIIPAVAIFILQQTLMIAMAMFIATLYEQKKAKADFTGWLGRILAFSAVSWILGLLYFGWFFYILDVGRGGNLPGEIILLGLFAPAVAALGCLLGLLLQERERAMYVLIFTSIPCYLLAGVSWPAEAMPPLLALLRWLIPSTASIQASIHLNQMGATVFEVKYYLLNILLIGIAALIVLYKVGTPAADAKENHHEL